MSTTVRPDDEEGFLAPGGALAGALGQRLLERLGPPRPKPGQRFGPFALVRALGRGGMGEVWLARRADGAFEQQVALKWLQGGLFGDADALLARERGLLAGLDHPHIARLIDGGRSEAGLTWFAMEYVDGLRLDAHAREHRLDLRARLRLLLPLCAALAFAHRRLVVHGDLKPANVMVDREGQPKLLDFGIARLLKSDSDGLAAALTPGWASPEQRRGEALGTASDVYQLGLLLACLSQLPAQTDLSSTALPETVLAAPLTADAVPPETLKDPELRAIALRACAPRPEQRYPSVDAFADDLRAWLAHRPVSAVPASAFYRLRKRLRRHPLAGALGLAGGLALVALGLGLQQQREAALAAAARAEREALQARRESERSAAALGFLGELLGKAQPGEHRGRIPTVEDALQAGAERLSEDSAMPPALRGALLARLGSIRIERSEFGQARALLEAAVPLLRAADEDPVLLSEAEGELAYSLDYSDSARALPLFDGAIARLSALPDEQPRRLRLQRLRASLLYGIGRYEDAAAALRGHLAESDARLGEDSVESGMGRVLLAMSLNAQGDIEGGLAASAQAWRTLKAALGEAHPRSVQAGNGYASALYNHGRYAEQIAVLDELLATARRLWGEAHPRVALLLTWKGAGLLAAERAAEATEALERAAALYAAADPDDDLGSPNTLGALGDAYAALGRSDDALAAYARMAQVERERTTALPPDDGSRAIKPARLLVQLGRHDEARRALSEAESRAARSGHTNAPLRRELDALREAIEHP
ncbi:MAG: serine/threonine protein kinase [Xanthomonadales bacterium]|nr:serine/threonine protein kinase [Xanthomonadales bacterium]